MITVVIIITHLSYHLAKWNNSLYLDVLLTFLLYMYLYALYVSLCFKVQENAISSKKSFRTPTPNNKFYGGRNHIRQELLYSLFHWA